MRQGQHFETLVRLDAALLSLRRLTNAPASRPKLRHRRQQLEVSTLLVVDALSRCSGRPAGDVSVALVAQALQVAPSTASRLVDRAVGAGMVTRTPSVHDPRRHALSLTRAGRDLQAAAVSFRTGRLASLVEHWKPEDVEALTILLERFAARVVTSAQPHPTENPHE